MTENLQHCSEDLSTSSCSCFSCNCDFQQILKLLEEDKNKMDFQILFDKLEVMTVKEEVASQEIIKELQELNEKTSGNQKILDNFNKINFELEENKKLKIQVEQQKIFIKKLEEDKLTKDQVIKTMTENAEDNIREKNLTLLELVKKEEEMDKIREEGDEYFNKLSVSNDKLEESSKKINILEEENKKLNKNMSQLKKDIFQNKKNYEQEIQKFSNVADDLLKKKILFIIMIKLKQIKKTKIFWKKNEKLKSQLKNCYKMLQENKEKICSFEIEVKKLEKENNDSSIKNVELKTQLLEVYKKIGEKITFMKRPNEFCTIKIYPCCKNNCINDHLSDGICINGNGYINVHKNEIKYNISLTGGENNWIFLHSKHPFAKTSGYSNNYSLFYFEVTIYNEGNDS
uniref:Uncharacterized protein n=1 Tax=Meloidogyne enterolobii TaxID=390850 RepID=A0A6V7WFE5_MELEN|nr:unnamed protein product [Meloidogyne enterolobii]